MLGVITTGVTGLLGLVIRAFGTDVFAVPWVVSLLLLVTGIILWWTDSVTNTWRGATQMTVMAAVVIGLAQAIALFPGLSRSGLTIAAALALGMHRKIAAQYSFFVAIPTIVTATGVHSLSLLNHRGSLAVGGEAYLLAFIAAAVVGAGALWLVLRMLYRGHFRVFAVYVALLALATLIFQPSSSGILVFDQVPTHEVGADFTPTIYAPVQDT